MRVSFRTVLVGATAIGLVIGSVAQAQTPAPRNFYVFGDERSAYGNDGWIWDPANGYTGVNGSVFQGKTGWEFRFSNGPSWTERLGYQLGLSPDLKRLQAPWGGFAGQYRGYNFAHYGAAAAPAPSTTPTTTNGPGARHSADAQVNYYISQVNAGHIKKSANDLYSYWFTPYNGGLTGDSLVSASTATLQKIRNVADRRANVLALGSITLSQYVWISPQATGALRAALSMENQKAVQLNDGLKSFAASTATSTGQARVHYVDVPALINDIKANPSRYGFTNVGSTSVPYQICSASSCFTAYRPSIGDWLEAKAADPNANPNAYLWHDRTKATLSSRGNDILAYYTASTLGGVYAWDQFRAVGSGTGAAATSAISTASARTTTGFAQSMLGFSQVRGAKGAKVFALGLLDDQPGQMGLSQARGGSLKLIGSSVPLTSRLTVGGASFTDQSREAELDIGVRGSGGSGFATLDLGQGLDLNVMASSQNRTLNTNRPITFDYVGGVARSKTKVRLDVAQASLAKMFDVKGVKVGPVASVASVTERWGETRETGVPEWLAANRPAGKDKSTAVNFGLAADWGMTDKSGGQWSLSTKAGRIQADSWTPVAMVAPSQTLADALEQEKGSASFATIGAGREANNGWSFGLEAGIAKTQERQVEAVRARAVLRF